MPSVERLQTIEADDPHAALELLSPQNIYAESGTESAWLRDYADGAALRSISRQINLVPVARDN